MKYIGIIAVFLVYILYTIFSTPEVFAQACQAYLPNQSGVNNGLISTPSLSGKFGNTSNTCVTNLPSAAIPSYNLSDQQYASLKSRYFTQSKQTKSTTLPAGLSFSGDMIYNVPSLTVSSSPTGSGTEVIFIDGDLTVNSNIIYHTNDSNGGLVLVVGGNLYIAPTVSQIDGVLVAQGNIYTACTSLPCGAASSVQVISPLVVNGNIISLNTGTSQVYFERNLSNTTAGNSVPAEQANLQAKYYLLLKNLFTNTIIIETEGTNFAGAISSSAPTPTLTATPQNVTLNSSSQATFTLSWTGGGATSCSASSTPSSPNFSGSVAANGSASITVNSSGTYSYSIKCTNLQNIVGSASTAVTVSPAPSPTPTPNPLDSGLVSFWKFNEASGQSAADSVSTNNGTATGTTILNTGCIRGNCRSFNGVNDLINMGSGPNLHISSALTLSVWVYPYSNSGSSVPGILDMSTPGGNENYALLWYNNNFYFQAYPNYQYFFPGLLTPNTWQHIVVTFSNGGNLGFYKNGIAQAGGAFNNNSGGPLPTSPTDTLKIGYYAVFSTGYFAGKIDEVGIWNRVLSGNEVKLLYNNGTGVDLP